MLPVIDAHIHIDAYNEEEQSLILNQLQLYKIDSLIVVSNHLASAQNVLTLADANSRIKPAIGYHPEQILPTEQELDDLLQLINQHHHQLIGIGEVGLPHYLRRGHPNISINPYINVLETFIQTAKTYDLPIILHAVYEDALLACDLLEKYNVKKAHFHWFKGDEQIIKKMIDNQYYISITPDILYKERTKKLVKEYPLSLIMVETDGPWPFEGPFNNELTHPKMVHQSISEIALLKQMDIDSVYIQLYRNTVEFYSLNI